MNINPLSSNLVNLLSAEPLAAPKEAAGGNAEGSFADLLSESLKTASLTDTADKMSALELLTGQTDDLSGLMLDMQKAELSLTLALQIRNKLLEAYNEIIRMQV